MAENTKKWEETGRRYRTYIKLEKRLSQNTVESYMRDLRQFAHFILRQYDVAPRKVEGTMIERYMAWLYDRGREKTSQARCLCGIRSFFNFLSFFTMIFGGGLVPTYIVSKQLLGLSENYAALIVPLLVSPFNIIVMRSFFKSSVPLELIEAATIDGSGEYSTLFRVVVPIAKPGIATIALLNALAYWNDWFNSLLYIQQKKVLQPLQALLMELQNNTEYLNRMAGMLGPDAIAEAAKMPSQALRMVLVVFIVVPIACAYPFFQRYIVSGLTVGSVKG